jgi:hypothetical protein
MRRTRHVARLVAVDAFVGELDKKLAEARPQAKLDQADTLLRGSQAGIGAHGPSMHRAGWSYSIQSPQGPGVEMRAAQGGKAEAAPGNHQEAAFPARLPL